MGLSAPKTIYGVHAFTFFNRATKVPAGILKVVGSVGLTMSGSFNDLYGGSSRFAYDSEPGVLNFELKLNSKQFESFLFTKALGAAVTNNGAEATGNVSTLTAQSGTGLKSATVGVASVSAKAGSEGDLKSGLYVMVAADATHVNLYCLSDYDFNQGTAEVFVDDTLKINASPILIADTGATVDVAGFGLTITSGSGTVALTANSTAYFYVRKENSGSDLITVGQSTQTFSEFGCLWSSQKKANGDTFEVYLPRAKAIGLPLAMTEMAWLTGEVNIKGLYDSVDDCVYKARSIRA